jgi:hypothetical protein
VGGSAGLAKAKTKAKRKSNENKSIKSQSNERPCLLSCVLSLMAFGFERARAPIRVQKETDQTHLSSSAACCCFAAAG